MNDQQRVSRAVDPRLDRDIPVAGYAQRSLADDWGSSQQDLMGIRSPIPRSSDREKQVREQIARILSGEPVEPEPQGTEEDRLAATDDDWADLDRELERTRQHLIASHAIVLEGLAILEEEHLSLYQAHELAIEQVQEIRLRLLERGPQVASQSSFLMDVIQLVLISSAPGLAARVLTLGFRFIISITTRGAGRTASIIMDRLNERLVETLQMNSQKLSRFDRPGARIRRRDLKTAIRELRQTSERNQEILQKVVSSERFSETEVLQEFAKMRKEGLVASNRADEAKWIRVWLSSGTAMDTAAQQLANLLVQVGSAAKNVGRPSRRSTSLTNAPAVSLQQSAQERLGHWRRFLGEVRSRADLLLQVGLYDDRSLPEAIVAMTELVLDYYQEPVSPAIRKERSRVIMLQSELMIWAAVLGDQITEVRRGYSGIPSSTPLTEEQQDQLSTGISTVGRPSRPEASFSGPIPEALLAYLVQRFPQKSSSPRQANEAMLQKLFNLKAAIDEEARRMKIPMPIIVKDEPIPPQPSSLPNPDESLLGTNSNREPRSRPPLLSR